MKSLEKLNKAGFQFSVHSYNLLSTNTSTNLISNRSLNNTKLNEMNKSRDAFNLKKFKKHILSESNIYEKIEINGVHIKNAKLLKFDHNKNKLDNINYLKHKSSKSEISLEYKNKEKSYHEKDANMVFLQYQGKKMMEEGKTILKQFVDNLKTKIEKEIKSVHKDCLRKEKNWFSLDFNVDVSKKIENTVLIKSDMTLLKRKKKVEKNFHEVYYLFLDELLDQFNKKIQVINDKNIFITSIEIKNLISSEIKKINNFLTDTFKIPISIKNFINESQSKVFNEIEKKFKSIENNENILDFVKKQSISIIENPINISRKSLNFNTSSKSLFNENPEVKLVKLIKKIESNKKNISIKLKESEISSKKTSSPLKISNLGSQIILQNSDKLEIHSPIQEIIKSQDIKIKKNLRKFISKSSEVIRRMIDNFFQNELEKSQINNPNFVKILPKNFKTEIRDIKLFYQDGNVRRKKKKDLTKKIQTIITKNSDENDIQNDESIEIKDRKSYYEKSGKFERYDSSEYSYDSKVTLNENLMIEKPSETQLSKKTLDPKTNLVGNRIEKPNILKDKSKIKNKIFKNPVIFKDLQFKDLLNKNFGPKINTIESTENNPISKKDRSNKKINIELVFDHKNLNLEPKFPDDHQILNSNKYTKSTEIFQDSTRFENKITKNNNSNSIDTNFSQNSKSIQKTSNKTLIETKNGFKNNDKTISQKDIKKILVNQDKSNSEEKKFIKFEKKPDIKIKDFEMNMESKSSKIQTVMQSDSTIQTNKSVNQQSTQLQNPIEIKKSAMSLRKNKKNLKIKHASSISENFGNDSNLINLNNQSEVDPSTLILEGIVNNKNTIISKEKSRIFNSEGSKTLKLKNNLIDEISESNAQKFKSGHYEIKNNHIKNFLDFSENTSDFLFKGENKKVVREINFSSPIHKNNERKHIVNLVKKFNNKKPIHAIELYQISLTNEEKLKIQLYLKYLESDSKENQKLSETMNKKLNEIIYNNLIILLDMHLQRSELIEEDKLRIRNLKTKVILAKETGMSYIDVIENDTNIFINELEETKNSQERINTFLEILNEFRRFLIFMKSLKKGIKIRDLKIENKLQPILTEFIKK